MKAKGNPQFTPAPYVIRGKTYQYAGFVFKNTSYLTELHTGSIVKLQGEHGAHFLFPNFGNVLFNAFIVGDGLILKDKRICNKKRLGAFVPRDCKEGMPFL